MTGLREPAGAAPQRWVLHVDMDQFIAAVELQRHPELIGRPVLVGGAGDPALGPLYAAGSAPDADPATQERRRALLAQRTVVSTASYEARAFGVHSGMPLRLAARKCPEAVLLPVDHPHYEAASARVMDTLRAVPGGVLEVLGWDEAFLGVVTDDPLGVARQAQGAVLEATGLHCTVGIGDTTVRAKIATSFGKPRGVFTLTAANWTQVMGDRPVTALWGVGPRVTRRLAALGITTVAELAAADESALVAEFGPAIGPHYRGLGRGDGRNTVSDEPRVARSHSRETTFQHNLEHWDEVTAELKSLTRKLFDDVVAEGQSVARVAVKVRYAPFFTVSKIAKLPAVTSDYDELEAGLLRVLDRFERDRPVRLLGVRAEFVRDDQ